MKESALQKKIQKLIESYGGWVVKYHGSQYSKAGVPDLLACIHGRFLAIEVKLPGNKATKIQDAEIKRVREAGGTAFVADNVEMVEQFLHVMGAMSWEQ